MHDIRYLVKLQHDADERSCRAYDDEKDADSLVETENTFGPSNARARLGLDKGL